MDEVKFLREENANKHVIIKTLLENHKSLMQDDTNYSLHKNSKKFNHHDTNNSTETRKDDEQWKIVKNGPPGILTANNNKSSVTLSNRFNDLEFNTFNTFFLSFPVTFQFVSPVFRESLISERFRVYLFSRMALSRKFHVYLISRNGPKFAKLAKVSTRES